MTEPDDDLLAMATADADAAGGDKLTELRALCAALRDADATIADLEERLQTAKASKNKLCAEVIPDKMDECGVAAVELAADGNAPAVRVEVKPHISANIAAGWPEDKRRAAFDWLEENDAGDLIKTAISVRFPREERPEAVRIAQLLRNEYKLEVLIDENVHGQTLTAWLKEKIKNNGGPSGIPLDKIGGHVGRVAAIKQNKKKS